MVMANRFKNPDLRRVYDGYLAFAYDSAGPLYKDGRPHRGGGTRCAFWDGYEMMPNHKFPPGSQSYAAFRAGQDFRRAVDKDLKPARFCSYYEKGPHGEVLLNCTRPRVKGGTRCGRHRNWGQ